MKKADKILIVGGVAGGATAAARLRRLDEKAEIIMLEKGEYISFANCGLPYYIGDEITEKSSLTLQTPESFNARYNVDVRNFSEVTKINTSEKTVTIKRVLLNNEYTQRYDKLVLSMGAMPLIPNIKGINSQKVFTLRNIPDTYKIKDYINKNSSKSVAIIGGGFIGIEMAENLKKIGTDVTIIEMSEQIMPPIDYEMAAQVHSYIKSKNINLLLKTKLLEIDDTENGVCLKLEGAENLNCDIVILAIGIIPDTALVKNTQIKLNEKGYIITDNQMRTNVKDVFAVGDATEIENFITGNKTSIALAGPANKEARIAADVIAESDYKNLGYKGSIASSIVKIFDLTVATTGISEKIAKNLNIDYDKSYTYSQNHAGYFPGASNMSMKIIFEKITGKILGAQIVGYSGVDKRCDVIATAISFGATAFDLTRVELCYAPPFSSAKDPVNIAGFVIENTLTGKVKNIHFSDVDSLINDDNTMLIDVRTKGEYAHSHIENFINIPLDSLRNNLNKIDKTKKIYVTCQVGFRGYVASRILTQNGFDVYNLNGGFRLYDIVNNSKK